MRALLFFRSRTGSLAAFSSGPCAAVRGCFRDNGVGDVSHFDLVPGADLPWEWLQAKKTYNLAYWKLRFQYAKLCASAFGWKKVAVECKVGSAPKLGKGFWNALNDLEIKEAWVIAPVQEPYPIQSGVVVSPLRHFLAQAGNL